jgi:ornithine decarboxylase
MARLFNIEKAHSEIVSKNTVFKILKYLDKHDVRTPVLFMDRDKLREKATLVGRNIRNAQVFYALKANPAHDVAEFVASLGLGFEIASEGELKILKEIGVGPERVITSNPVKSFTFLRAAAEFGIRYFAFDSVDEVDKLVTMVPGARAYIRLSVPNEGSDWPLSRKFGVEIDEALKIFDYALDKGLDVAGITFHVGSQCTNKYSWNTALFKARELWEMAEHKGIKMDVLNIGGGYPINYTRGVVGVETIEKNIDELVREYFPEDVKIFIEPGRAVVGDAGVFLSSVIGKAQRRQERWLSIDVGVFNGMMESVGGIKYTYVTETKGTKPEGRKINYVVAGPSCDSFDVIQKEVPLHEPAVGDLMMILAAGAYTTSYASEFNGFQIPGTILI